MFTIRSLQGWLVISLVVMSAGTSKDAAAAPDLSDDVAVSVAPCVPGSGRDYRVGPSAGQLSSLDQVPWENLAPGDTVRIFYKTGAYPGKFMIKAHGTASAPVRICGVKGPNGERPIISGINAPTRKTLVYGDSYSGPIYESRGIIMIKKDSNGPWTDYPTYIQIDGLNIRGAYPTYSFIDTAGVVKPYTDFGACIWVDRGQNITIADNEISDCTNGIFTKSTEDGDFAVTKNILISGNYIYGHGVANDVHEHNTYIQSVNVIYEFNRFGPLRAGALGNLIKDRSVGTVVRFNRLDGGAHSIDLVEAEDFANTAMVDPNYRLTYVYGNQIKHDASGGSAIHYGGDHYGSTPGGTWGEPIFRKGTLYFWNNALYSYSSSSLWNAVLFQVSTTEEKVEAWNNIFYTNKTNISNVSFRGYSEVAYPWIPGGMVNFGKNWTNTGWMDFVPDAYRPMGGSLTGTSKLITGATAPMDLTTMIPLVGSSVVDSAQSQLSAVSGYPVNYQLSPSFTPQVRVIHGAAMDIGAVEL